MNSGTNELTNFSFQPFGFKSGLYDSDTVLIYFGARWYDPATGRWISKGPILLAGGLNLYAFCGNDPVNYSDPSGLCEVYDKQWVEGWLAQEAIALSADLPTYDHVYKVFFADALFDFRNYGLLPGNRMGNVGIGYSGYMAYGPLITAGICVYGECDDWQGKGAALESWADNLTGMEEAKIDFYGTAYPIIQGGGAFTWP